MWKTPERPLSLGVLVDDTRGQRKRKTNRKFPFLSGDKDRGGIETRLPGGASEDEGGAAGWRKPLISPVDGIVNSSELGGKMRNLYDGQPRYSGVFFLGMTSNRARISSS